MLAGTGRAAIVSVLSARLTLPSAPITARLPVELTSLVQKLTPMSQGESGAFVLAAPEGLPL